MTSMVRDIAQLFQIPDLVPYSMRHSGPSQDRAENARTSEEVRKRGRWASTQAVRRYEKAGRLSQTTESYSPRFVQYAKICETQLEDVMLGLQTVPNDAGLYYHGK
jgi:hypothetical protein